MAGRIAGITIVIDGDTSKLNNALKKTDDVLQKTRSNLRDVNKLLRMDPKSTVLLEQKQKNLQTTVEETKKRLAELKKADAEVSKNKGNYDAWKAQYDPIREEIDKTLKKEKELKKQLEKMQKSDKVDTDEYKKLQEELKETQKKAKDLEEEAKAVSKAFGNPISPEGYDALQREIIDTEQKLRKAEKAAKDFGSVGAQKIAARGKAWEAFGNKVQAAGEKMSSAGQALMPLTGAIVGVGAASYKAWKEVDAGGDSIARMTGATGEALAEMQALSNEIATEIPTSFETAGNAIGEVATRFDLQGAALKSLSSAYVKFADVNKSDVTSAIDSTQKAMAAWNISAEDAGLYLDALTAASQKTGVKIETISAQAATNAAALKEVGFGASDAALFLGMLEKNGVDASGAMAGLKKAYANALKDGTSLKDQLMELETGLQNEETRADAAAAAIELFGTRAGGALTEALASGRISFAELGTDLQDFAGTVENTFNATLDPIDKVQTTLNELKLAGADLFNAAGPLITEVLGKATAEAQKLSKWLGTLSDDEKRQVIRMAGIAAAAGPVLMVVGKLTSGVGKAISAGGKILQLAPKLSGAAKTVTKGITGMNGSVLSSVAGFAAAHPAILLVVGALATLTAGMIALKKHHDNFIQKTWGLTEAEKEANQAILDSAEAYREAEAARKETIRGIGEEYGYYERLAAELLSITDSDGRVLESKKARADFIVGTLNDALGLEIEMIDGVIQANESLQSSIDNTIQKKKAEAYLDADQDSYKEAIQNQYSAQMKYISATNKRVDAEKELAAAQQQYSDILAEQASSSIPLMYAGQVATAKDAVEAASAALHGFEIAETQAQQEWLGFVNTIENHAALEEAIKSGEGLDIAMQNLANGFVTAENATHSMLNQQLTDFTLKYEQMKVAAEQGSSAVTETELSAMAALVERARAEYYKGGVDSGMALAEGMNAGIPAVEQSNAALDAAATPPQTNTGKWGEAGNAPPQAYAAGMQGGAGEVQGAASAVEQAATPPAGNTAAWGAAGAENPQAYAAGMQGGAGQAQSAGAQVTQAGIAGEKSLLPQVQAGGQSFGATNAAGIIASLPVNSAAGLTIAGGARDAAGSVSLYPTGYSQGSSYGSGLVNGLLSMLGRVRAAASTLSSAAGSAGNAALEINSPSHVAQRTGQGYGEGLILGMHDMQRDVSRAATRLAGMVAAGAPTAMIDYPNQQAEIAARSITVTAQAAPTDGGVSQMLGAILTRLNNLDVVIRNAGQFADGVTNYANRRLGRISTLQESGVI